jgi:hypothetical protein
MPRITPATKGLLTRGTELILNYTNPAARTIQIVKTGDVDDGGVTLQALYARLMDLWKTEADLPQIPFPIAPITEEKMDLVNNWDFADDTTRHLLRDGGWSVRDSSNVATQMWAGIVGLGSMGAADQPYLQQSSTGAAVNFVLQGQINQAIQILKTGAGAFDYRSYLKLFVREQGKTYGQSTLNDIGLTSLDYRRYPAPIGNSLDTKITASDATIASTQPYTGMTLTYFAANQPRTIGGTSYNYNIVIDGNGGTAEQIYEFAQYKLRQNSDIDAGTGTVTGKTADSLLRFVGDNLITSTGVFIDNYQSADINRITFTDVTSVGRVFPYTAAGTIAFNPVIQSDPSAKYFLFFINPGSGAGDEYGNAGAVIVNDAAGVPISGSVSGAASKSFTFAYDSNVQSGRTSGTDALVICVVVGGSVNGSQFASSGPQTITRSTQNVISVSGVLDRVYA